VSSCRPGLEQGAWRTCRVSRNGMVYGSWMAHEHVGRGENTATQTNLGNAPSQARSLVSMRHVRHVFMARVSHECRIDTSLGWRTTTRLIQCYIQG